MLDEIQRNPKAREESLGPFFCAWYQEQSDMQGRLQNAKQLSFSCIINTDKQQLLNALQEFLFRYNTYMPNMAGSLEGQTNELEEH